VDTQSALVDALHGGGTVGAEAGAQASGASDHVGRARDTEFVTSETDLMVDSLNTIAALLSRSTTAKRYGRY
jgi:hypothetical protein